MDTLYPRELIAHLEKALDLVKVDNEQYAEANEALTKELEILRQAVRRAQAVYSELYRAVGSPFMDPYMAALRIIAERDRYEAKLREKETER